MGTKFSSFFFLLPRDFCDLFLNTHVVLEILSQWHKYQGSIGCLIVTHEVFELGQTRNH
jgi:hypothetical protein